VLSADKPATGRAETKKDADISPAPSVMKENELGTFDWERQWYPIAVDEYTDRSRPHKMQLLGNDIVLWHDKTQWRVFDDSCPHRGVPLSKLSYIDASTVCSIGCLTLMPSVPSAPSL
jgi:phenylpropionate dioxygenase-like ring-hydroxylating dioxygenase large terminal subunit